LVAGAVEEGMKIKAIGFVGIPVTDIKRLRSFYEGVLGLKVAEEMMSEKWIEHAIGDDTLTVASVSEHWTPSDQGTGAAFEIEDFNEAIKHLHDQRLPFRR
jgi:predicted enzyme related to lactoylglutathione lyase